MHDENFTHEQDIQMDQVFMRDRETLRKIIDFADLRKTETVLEIGTGPGNLTRLLAKGSRQVITIEADRSLEPTLKRELHGLKNVRVIWGNALEVIENEKLHFDKMVSNPPYSISEPLMKALFGKPFKFAVLTLPWRFVERLTANPLEGRYSKLSLFAQAFFRIETLLVVPGGAWSPEPGTNSCVMRITPRPAKDRGERILRQLALQSDKKLRNALREAIIRSDNGKGTKRKASDAMDDIGLPEKMMKRKISEMDLREIKAIIQAIGKLA